MVKTNLFHSSSLLQTGNSKTMADTVVDTTTTEVKPKDLKEKKEVAEEVEKVEKVEKGDKEKGAGDAPANGTKANGADHGEETPEDEEDDEDEGEEEEGEGGEEDAAVEADGHPVKRPAEAEEKAEVKKQKTENSKSTEAEVKA
ncbi:hypothetical protein AAFF_G00394990 [Aldrovandia affinis]|uniref:Uncharacterized protein n=1 Tax=Aldrovandia affinis TaxID=143900 RepID=A0AAD7SDS4_9TELE|nr:hypothetical protein AAFF_G00394990 [Aldrovandia affinis]